MARYKVLKNHPYLSEGEEILKVFGGYLYKGSICFNATEIAEMLISGHIKQVMKKKYSKKKLIDFAKFCNENYLETFEDNFKKWSKK